MLPQKNLHKFLLLEGQLIFASYHHNHIGKIWDNLIHLLLISENLNWWFLFISNCGLSTLCDVVTYCSSNIIGIARKIKVLYRLGMFLKNLDKNDFTQNPCCFQ